VRFPTEGIPREEAARHQGAFRRVETSWCCEQLSQAHRPRSSAVRHRIDFRAAFSAPFRLCSTVTRTSGVTASRRLASPARFALRLAVARDARCVRPTSASQHIHYEHPRLARSRVVMRPGESGVSRRRGSLRRAKGQRCGAFSSPRRASDRASGALVASRAHPAFLLAESRASSRRQVRFGHRPRERGVAPATGSTFRREVASSSRVSSHRFRPSRR